MDTMKKQMTGIYKNVVNESYSHLPNPVLSDQKHKKSSSTKT